VTLDDLKARRDYWQEILRLQDWDVPLRVCRSYAMKREDCLAYIEVYENKREAHITFLDPSDYDPDGWPQEELEQSLIHELIHLHLWAFNPEEDTPQWTAMEQAVHSLAQAVYRLGQFKEQVEANAGVHQP
jgi:hypothetical protein